MPNYFTKAGDLPHEGTSYFKSAGDLVAPSTEEIENYLVEIVSGKKYGYESELGILCGGGSITVTLAELKEMVAMGYNIVSANYIGVDMIAIEFQQFRKNNNQEKWRGK